MSIYYIIFNYVYLLFSGKPNEVIFFRDIQRTFPQGSNYWGTNLSQVEMALYTGK